MNNAELLKVLLAAKPHYDECLRLNNYAFMCNAVRTAKLQGDITPRQKEQTIRWINKKIRYRTTLGTYLHECEDKIGTTQECQEWWEKVIADLEQRQQRQK